MRAPVNVLVRQQKWTIDHLSCQQKQVLSALSTVTPLSLLLVDLLFLLPVVGLFSGLVTLAENMGQF